MLKKIITVGLVLSLSLSSALACTGLQVKTEDGASISGRTLEFGIFLPTSAISVPRNYSFIGKTPKGDGKKWKSKYASIGVLIGSEKLILDGVNEKGLTCGMFYLPGYASYPETTKKNQNISMSTSDFNQWVLSQFKNVDEVKKAIVNGEVAFSKVLTPGFPPSVQPFHFLISDKNGKSIVVEPIDGKVVVSDNPVGVLTNSPTFDWHMTNLKNYVNLRAVNSKPITINGEKFDALGQGTGMLGLPGDYTPPSRFVRAVAFSATAIPEKNAQQGVYQVFHLLNNFDIPVGIARTVHKGVIYSDYTMLTTVRDSQNLKFYYTTYEDQTIKMLDLNEVDKNAKEIKILSTESKQHYVDVSSKLK
ncbi:MAG TPA: choloylglycine hydrolase family protein [Sulfurimonas sp.]|nr:choloylglycine hydrolase family protein [Sulfurimonas sp.]